MKGLAKQGQGECEEEGRNKGLALLQFFSIIFVVAFKPTTLLRGGAWQQPFNLQILFRSRRVGQRIYLQTCSMSIYTRLHALHLRRVGQRIYLQIYSMSIYTQLHVLHILLGVVFSVSAGKLQMKYIYHI